jgi:hypothetical protein
MSRPHGKRTDIGHVSVLQVSLSPGKKIFNCAVLGNYAERQKLVEGIRVEAKRLMALDYHAR